MLCREFTNNIFLSAHQSNISTNLYNLITTAPIAPTTATAVTAAGHGVNFAIVVAIAVLNTVGDKAIGRSNTESLGNL